MLVRNMGVVYLSFLFTGCITSVSEEPDCEGSCELVEVCEEKEVCDPVLVEVGKELVCEEQVVSLSDQVCVSFTEDVVTCEEEQVEFTSPVQGEGFVSVSTNVCDTDQVTTQGEACGLGEASFETTTCVEDQVAYGDEFCAPTSSEVTRTVDFEISSSEAIMPSGLWGEVLEDAYEDWGLEISVANYNGSPSSTSVALFDSTAPTGWGLGS